MRVLFRILLILWFSGIFFISFSPNPSQVVPFYVSVGESVLHFFAFFVLFFLLYFSFPFKNKSFLFRIALSAIFTLLFSIAKEIGQLFVPVRAFTLNDLLIDWMGGGLSAFMLMGYNLLTRIDHS
jgi:VanZ family protein